MAPEIPSHHETQNNTPLTLGSLFDGIGVFPLAASRHGIIPLWASEIEKAPISITRRHFPRMEHLGDITKMDGGQIPAVHMVPSANNTLRDGKTVHSDTPDSLHNGSQFTPETRMKQQAMEKLERSVRADHPKNGHFREVPHYGGTPQNTYTTKKEHSKRN